MAAILPSLAPSRSFSLFSLAPRVLQPYLHAPSWSLPCEASSSTFPISAESSLPRPSSSTWYNNLIPSIESLAEFFPSILLAVPKHKVTHSRKSMRSANKGLKNKTNFSHCEACGSIKLSHNLCPKCYSQISRRWKAEARGDNVNSLREVPKSSGSVEEIAPPA